MRNCLVPWMSARTFQGWRGLAVAGMLFAVSVPVAAQVTVHNGPPVTPASFSKSATTLTMLFDTPPPGWENRPLLEPGFVNKKQSNGRGPTVAAPTAPPGSPAMPATSVSFDGLNFVSNGSGFPPDTNGDVGPNHYIQVVNTSIGIFSKSGGPALAAFSFNSLWMGAGTGTSCDTTNRGDPVVNYDAQTGRWFILDFAWTDTMNGPYYFCLAVSKTPDPVSGGWWLYGIRADDAAHPWLPDYPKLGIWPDGLYAMANMFDCLNASCSSATYMEVRNYAFNKDDLIAGAALRQKVVDQGATTYFTMLPSNLRGTPPPPGTPNYFVSESQTAFAWQVFKFQVDWVGAGTTFTGPTNVSQTTYVLAASTVATPAPGNTLDTLRERMMNLVQYRNLGGVESLWVSHTTGTTTGATPTGTQWGQINVTGGVVATTPVQQQIFNNGLDGLNRFMGSIAVDTNGNAALGYSATSAAVNPDIRYVGRLTGDPLNTLPQGESVMQAGLGTPVGNCGGAPCHRWGDYSAMTVDPDGCTFWYTNEYLKSNTINWDTRIGAFRFPACTGNVTPLTTITRGIILFNRQTQVWSQTVTVTNNTGLAFSNVGYVLDSLNAGWTLTNGNGSTTAAMPPAGSPYKDIGGIGPGATASFALTFSRVGTPAFAYTPRVLDGPTR